MKISTELLEAFFPQGKNIRRASWPIDEFITADGAEGGTIWYYNATNDELNPDYCFDFQDMTADDWEISG